MLLKEKDLYINKYIQNLIIAKDFPEYLDNRFIFKKKMFDIIELAQTKAALCSYSSKSEILAFQLYYLTIYSCHLHSELKSQYPNEVVSILLNSEHKKQSLIFIASSFKVVALPKNIRELIIFEYNSLLNLINILSVFVHSRKQLEGKLHMVYSKDSSKKVELFFNKLQKTLKLLDFLTKTESSLQVSYEETNLFEAFEEVRLIELNLVNLFVFEEIWGEKYVDFCCKDNTEY